MSQVPEINDRFNSFESNMTSMTSSPVSNSPSNSPKVNWPIIDHFVKENTPNMRNSIPVAPGLPSLVSDPGFAERAAKFSCFGSRSFNGRTSQLGLNSVDPNSQIRSSVSTLIGNSKLPRVSSSPLLKINRSGHDHKSTNSNEEQESSVSEHIEIGLKNDSSSRKRKVASLKGKAKDIPSPGVKEEENDEMNTKKPKKTEEGTNGETEKSKVPEPPKDYIHVRARRGQATDSHSLAERVRREKISERMKLLQDLVPGCNKVTGKALMLDEIINYVQSLQHQVEFLSMKLATVNPRQDLDMNGHISKDMNQLYPIEPSTSDFYQQNPQQLLFIGSTPMTQSPTLPTVHGFSETFTQFAGFEGDDLHSIVKMGFGDSRNQSPEMKIEL